MRTPPFIPSVNPGEVICSSCFLTIRPTENATLEEAKAQHNCMGMDLKTKRVKTP